MVKVIDIKEQILEELKNERYIDNVDENSKIVQMLRNASKTDGELKEDFDNYQEKKRAKYNTISNDEEFRFAWRVGKTNYNYYASNYGRIKVALLDSDLNDKNRYFLIESKNGYLVYDNNKYKDFPIAEYTDIYSFVVEAFRIEFDYNRKLLDEYIKNGIRLEVHHINNQPDDNRIDNLIYLPRTIHSYAHG